MDKKKKKNHVVQTCLIKEVFKKPLAEGRDPAEPLLVPQGRVCNTKDYHLGRNLFTCPETLD